MDKIDRLNKLIEELIYDMFGFNHSIFNFSDCKEIAQDIFSFSKGK